MINRKWLFFIFIIVCFVFLTSCVKEKTENFTLNDIELNTTFDVFDIVLNKNNVYVADKNKIHIYNLDTGKSTGVIDNKFQYCQSLYAGKDKLYAYDSSEKMLFSIDYSNKKVINKNKCPDNIIIDKFVINQGNIISIDKKRGKIDIYNLKTKERKSCDIENIRAMCLYDEDNILLVQANEDQINMNVIKFNYMNGHSEYIGTVEMPAVIDISYCSDSQTAIFADSKNICEYSISDISSMVLTSKLEPGVFYEKLAVEGNIITIADNNDLLEIYNISSLKNVNTIKVLTTDMDWPTHSQWITGELKDKYGKVNIKVNALKKLEYKSRILLKFMANDNDFDIFQMDKYTDYQIIQKKRYVNLAAHHNINDAFDEVFPEIKELCSYDSEIIGVPHSILFYVWKLNEELKNELDIKLPKSTWNWEQFFELAKKVRSISKEKPNLDAYILSSSIMDFFSFAILEDYNAQHIDMVKGDISYNTKEMKYLIELWKKLYDENLVLDNGSIFEPSKDNILFNQNVYNGIGKYDDYIMPPYTTAPTFVSLYCINRESANIEASVDFLAAFLSSSARKKNNINLLPYYKSYSIYEGYKDNHFITKKGYEFISKNIKKLRGAQDISSLEGSNNSENLGNLFTMFLNNEISSDELLETVDRKIEMMVNE